jgi:phage tail-like protein
MFGPKLYSPPAAFHFSVRIVESLDSKPTVGSALTGLGKMAINKALSATGALPEMDGRFMEVNGFGATLEMNEEIKEAGNNNEVIKLPGRITYTPLILKRGLVMMPTELGQWFKAILENNYSALIPRKNVVVSLLNENNLPLMSWGFEKAFPVKWELSAMNAMENQISFETIEIFYSRLVIMDSMFDKGKSAAGKITGAVSAKLKF